MKEDNQAVIKALNMYGRVPEMWELLEEIEILKSIIKEVREYIEEKKYWFCDEHDLRCEDGKKILEILDKENKNG